MLAAAVASSDITVGFWVEKIFGGLIVLVGEKAFILPCYVLTLAIQSCSHRIGCCKPLFVFPDPFNCLSGFVGGN